MTEGERIKQIRKDHEMTLEQFGKILGVTKVAISNIENGKRNVTEQMRKSICREFNIDPIWLATGEGDKYIDQSVELIAILDKLLHNENDFAKNLFKIFAQYSLEDWKDLERIANKTTEYMKQLEIKESPDDDRTSDE